MNLSDEIDRFSIAQSFLCSPDNAKQFIQQPSEALNILTQNIRSINFNYNNFETLLARIPFECDVLILTECWLPCRTNAYLPTLPNYTQNKTSIHRNQSDGVVVYVKSNLSPTLEELDFESSAFGLIVKFNSDIAILCVYRSPSIKIIDTFLSSLNTILTKLSNFKTVIIAGDINIDIKPTTLDSRHQDYLNCLAFHGYLPTHSFPTRENNCLDHIIIRSKLPSTTLILETTITDHYALLISSNIKPHRMNTTKNTTKINYVTLDETINNTDFSNVLNSDDPNAATNDFINIIKRAISSNTAYIKTSSRKKINKPWITPGLLRCINTRDRLHKSHKRSPDNETLKVTYIRYRSFCTKILKKVKRQHDTQELKKAGNNPKHLWENIKRITNTVKQTESSHKLLTLASTPVQSCNQVNEYFVHIGEELAQSFANVTSDPQMFPLNQQPNSFLLTETDPQEVYNTIMSLRSNATTGGDGISPMILKRYGTILSPILSHIFNLCFLKGVFPDLLKRAVVQPIFKGGDGNLLTNYRPIAILPAISKVLERIVNNKLVAYLEHFHLLSPHQFGFRKKRSTTDAVQELLDTIVQSLNADKRVLTIFLDLTKAFDTVPSEALLGKLEAKGIRGLQLDFFRSYLTGRSQRVKINDTTSEELPINYGVPQGSILGPTLFLVFIDDLSNIKLPNSHLVSFADDTAISFSADSWAELQIAAQNGFDTISHWLRINKLTLNTIKTKFITFSISSSPKPLDAPSIKAHSCLSKSNSTCKCPSLSQVDTIKYLGITLDNYLNFKSHIQLLSGRIRKLIYVFKVLRHVANPSVLQSVYYALCRSLITYCIACWGGVPKTTLKPLEVAQRAILKVATFRPLLFPTNELYKICKVLTVRQLFILEIIRLQHRKTPYIEITKRRKDKICIVPKTSYVFTKRFFYYLGPSLYNKINAELPVYKLTPYECKNRVRTLLLNKSYDETERYLFTYS